MSPSSSRRPRDLNQLAVSLVRDTVDDGPNEPAPENPDEARRVRENGRLGGLKGGKARAAKLPPQRRSEIAQKAARARWGAP